MMFYMFAFWGAALVGAGLAYLTTFLPWYLAHAFGLVAYVAAVGPAKSEIRTGLVSCAGCGAVAMLGLVLSPVYLMSAAIFFVGESLVLAWQQRKGV